MMLGVIFEVLSFAVVVIPLLVSTVRGANPCPKCTEQHINITSAVPGECDGCWPCDLIECHEGQGSSVACGTTVSHGSDISCVACVSGVNFSDSSGSGQCQPCGTCTGKYEHVLLDCNPEHDVKCECKDAYYHNKTTKECMPCASCCAFDGNIEERCRSGGGEIIGKKCKFKELWPKICLSSSPSSSSSSSTVDTDASMIKLNFSVTVTSSFLMTSSFSHATATPLLNSIRTAIVPTLSETVKNKVTLSTVSGHGRQSNVPMVSSTINIVERDEKAIKIDGKVEIHSQKTVNIISALFAVVSVYGVGCTIYICIMKCRSRKSINKQRATVMIYSELETAREKEETEISECSGVSEPLLNGQEDPHGIASLPSETGKATCGNYADSSKDLMLINIPERLEKGIPTSLDNGPRNQGQRPRKRIPSEGDDKSDPCLEVRQSHCYTDNYQDESVTMPAVNKMNHLSVHTAVQSNVEKPNSSSRDNVVSSSLATSISSDAEQISGCSNIQSVMGIHVANHDQVTICPSVESPIQSTEDNRGYFTHIKDVPVPLIHEICMLLDIERDVDGKDYKMLASKLEVKPAQITYLKELQRQSGRSPSYRLITQVFASMENSGTLKHLRSILEVMGRHDVIKVIDDWVSNNP